jgi:hypothetical protein
MGFGEMASSLQRTWQRLYPVVSTADIPGQIQDTFPRASELVVDTMAYQPYAQFGNKSMAQILPFGPKEMSMIEEAGRRLAANRDMGIIPPRFMISAARFALTYQLATPQTITDNFYRTLGRR